MEHVSRRSFLAGLSALPVLGVPAFAQDRPSSGARAQAAPPSSPAAAVGRGPDPLAAGYPATHPDQVKTLVGVSHTDVDEVRRLIERHPTLARAAWDWGFGDWETGLGAASHVGRREIAELLLAHGAEPTIFSAAMLGQLDVVRALVAARPGIQRTRGPHGITLLSHAQAGGADAEPVVKYLESVGDADVRLATAPLDAGERDRLVGRYTYGTGEADYFDVDVQRDQLGMLRPGKSRQRLHHAGDLVFFPPGVPSVKIAFTLEGGKAARLTIADPDVYLTARRVG